MTSKECEQQLKELIEAWDLNEALLNQTDINAIKHLLLENQMQHKQIEELTEKVAYLKSKCTNKDDWCQFIVDVAYDYDGYRKVESLMGLIEDLSKYALYARDNYDFKSIMVTEIKDDEDDKKVE